MFVRLSGCHLRCHYCDTSYAFREGDGREITDILDEVASFGTKLVQVTGGEPLLQPRVHDLMRELCDRGYTVMLETSGACSIAECDERVIRILDLKTPGSGEAGRNDMSNIDCLHERDEVKFVIVDRADYEWARDCVREYDLTRRCHAVLFSPVFEQAADSDIAGARALAPADLAAWMLADQVPARMQLQMHKHIWDPQARGV